MRRFTIALILVLSLLLLSALPAQAQQNGVYYTVRGGDTLASIAAHYGVSQQAIIDANNLYNPNHIFAGQVLLIPAGGAFHPPTAPGTVYRPTYTVQPGDTLFRIAQRYGVSLSALVQLNQIYNVNVLYAGRVLVLPEGVQTQPPVVQPPGQAFRYYVQPGDTLGKIARRYGVTLHALIAANHLSNPNRIYTGQVLVIP